MWGQERAHSLGFSVSQNLFSRSHGSVSRGILYHPGGSRLAPGFLGAEALPCSSFLYLLLQAIPAPPHPPCLLLVESDLFPYTLWEQRRDS